MFQRLPDAGGERVSFTIDGPTGGGAVRRQRRRGPDRQRGRRLPDHPGVRRPRGPYCMMGVCFDCLVTIDGTGNQQGCQIRVRPGMRVETQNGKREIDR